jgi:hypothetical protein
MGFELTNNGAMALSRRLFRFCFLWDFGNFAPSARLPSPRHSTRQPMSLLLALLLAMRATLSHKAHKGRGEEGTRRVLLTQLDFVGNLVAEADAAHGEDHFGRQFFMALEAAGLHGVAHRLFDFALRGDADLLEEFAQAGVEDVFVHDGLLMLRMVRMVQHVFAEIALRAVGLRIVVVALDVAILAAGDIFRGAHRDIVGAAERVVVAAGVGHGRLSPLKAAPEQRRDQQ